MLRKLAAVALCAASLVFAPVFAFDRASSDRAERTLAAKHLVESSRRHNVTHGENGFKVNNQEVNIHLDRSLKGISKVKLAQLLASNRAQLHVRTIEDQYGLDLKHQLKGGGPVAGAVAYWLTKTLCYSTAVAGAAGAVAATGGAAGFVAGGAAVGATLGASAPVAVIGGAIAQAGLAAPAATATLAVVQATGGMTAIASTVATVELASTHMGIIFTCMPWLP